MNSKSSRNSNLELLRIISMVLIVAHHYAYHGFMQFKLSYSFNRYLVSFLSLGGKLGVVCFILISGYFMCRSRFTLQKLLKLMGEVLFYSLTIGLIFLFILPHSNPIETKQLAKTFFPIGCGHYWFMTAYIMLMLISPLLNIVLERLSNSALLKIILFFTIVWSVIPTFASSECGFNYGFNNLGWFIILYFVGAYIRNRTTSLHSNCKKNFLLASGCYGLIILLNFLFIYLDHHTGSSFFADYIKRPASLNSPLVLLSAIELFVGFVKMPSRSNRFINTVAGASLGVYLIHDNIFIRPYLWNELFKNFQFYTSDYLIIHAIVTIALVYLGCTVIDLIRQATVEKWFQKFLDKHLASFQNKLNHLLNKAMQITG